MTGSARTAPGQTSRGTRVAAARQGSRARATGGGTGSPAKEQREGEGARRAAAGRTAQDGIEKVRRAGSAMASRHCVRSLRHSLALALVKCQPKKPSRGPDPVLCGGLSAKDAASRCGRMHSFCAQRRPGPLKNLVRTTLEDFGEWDFDPGCRCVADRAGVERPNRHVCCDVCANSSRQTRSQEPVPEGVIGLQFDAAVKTPQSKSYNKIFYRTRWTSPLRPHVDRH